MTPDQTQSVLSAIPIPLVWIGRDQRIKALNSRAEALLGGVVIGRHHVTVMRQPAVLACIEAAFETGFLQSCEYAIRDAARDSIYRVTASPLTAGEDGVMLGYEDIGLLQAADEMRRDFVANVSHELRSPLTAMLGFIETLSGPARDDAAARDRFLGIMKTEASRMNRLVQDLLSLSRVEANERQQPKTTVDLNDCLQRAVSTLERQAKEAGVQLNLPGAAQPMTVQGDADQLLQVLTNLIENAIKYGGREVSVTISEIARDPTLRDAAVMIEVADDGPGIDPLHIPRLTERFYRIDAHRSRDLGGTGLGLAIVKHIVNRHRGKLRIESAPGQGARFIVILPQGKSDPS